MAKLAVVFRNNIRRIDEIHLNGQPLNAKLVSSYTNKNPWYTFVSYIDAPLDTPQVIHMRAPQQAGFIQVSAELLWYNIDSLSNVDNSTFERLVVESALGLTTPIWPKAIQKLTITENNFDQSAGGSPDTRGDGFYDGRVQYFIPTGTYNSQKELIDGNTIEWDELKQDILDEVDVVRTSECIPFEFKSGIMDQYNQIIEDFERNDINLSQAQNRFNSLVSQYGDQARCIGEQANTCFTLIFSNGESKDYVLRDNDFETLLTTINSLPEDERPEMTNISDCGGQPQNITTVQDDVLAGEPTSDGLSLALLALLGLGGLAAYSLKKKRK